MLFDWGWSTSTLNIKQKVKYYGYFDVKNKISWNKFDVRIN